MLQFHDVIKVVAPTLTTQDRLRVDYDDLGISAEMKATCTPVILAKEDASGNGAVIDEIVTWNGDNLEIQEGTTGFTTGDVFVIGLVAGLPSHTATAATAS